MDTIYTVVLVVHTLIAVLLIALVLLQRGKGADAGAAFGAGASGTVFGSRGSASFFSRSTAFLATAFFATSLGLAYLSSQQTAVPESLLDSMPETEQAVPAAPDADALPSLEAEPEGAESDTIEALPAVEEEPQPGDE
jgi:preprotein translocase subunit SecG